MAIEHAGIESKTITTSAVVTTAGKPGLLYGITLNSGTTDSSILIEDGGSSGTPKWKLTLDGTTAVGETTESITFPTPIVCATDIFATLVGTNAVAWVAYKEIG